MSRPPRPQRLPLWLQVILVIAVLVALYLGRDKLGLDEPARPANNPPATTNKPEAKLPEGDRSKSTAVVIENETARNVVVRDEDGDVIYRGDIELAKTLDRIEDGSELARFPNDGEVFGNREHRLPRKPSGYYHEWVHPTPGLSGPGPQRIVTGQQGEKYYTPDHYGHFYLMP